jgi:ElaB/YqjD/DUF883 family membrane-anchored ribosome-binding protein
MTAGHHCLDIEGSMTKTTHKAQSDLETLTENAVAGLQDEAGEVIRQNPLVTLAITFLVGLLVGRLVL